MQLILDWVNKRIRVLVDFFTKPPSNKNLFAHQSASIVVRLRMTNYEQADAMNGEQSPDRIMDLHEDLLRNGAFLNYLNAKSKLLIFEIYDKSVKKEDIINIITKRYNTCCEETAEDAMVNNAGLGYA